MCKEPYRSGIVLFLLINLILGCTTTTENDSPRAILVSIDALNEEIMRGTLTPQNVPALYEIFDNGACADYAVTAFPSLTAPSHSAIWTGAYGDVTGISGNSQHRVPRNEFTIADRWTGFHYDPLSAESIWLSAARSGMKVAAHQTTQAPGVPGYLPRTGERSDSLVARRSEAEEILSGDNVMAFNGYNRMIAGDAMLTKDDVTWMEISDWSGVDELNYGVDPKAFSFENEAGEFYGLLYGDDSYDSVLISNEANVSGAIHAYAAEPESQLHQKEALAQHFSEALEISVDNGSVFLRVRLFEVEENGSDFMLFHPRLQVMEANNPDLRQEYDQAVRGWIGNSALGVYRNGGFGTTHMDGGNGTAERRYLETAELVTRQFIRGSEWLWNEKDPQFLLDYFPLSDSIDHSVLGYLDETAPMFDGDLAELIREFRADVWGYTDMRVRHLMDLAAEKNAAFFITGDHGMRSTWNVFNPNAALKEAGLLVLTEDGEVNLSQTKALSPNGYWITINTEEWSEGIVSLDEKEKVIQAVKDALNKVKTADGESVVTAIYTPDENPDLGLGGPAGGDVYWGVKEGFRSSYSTNSTDVIEEGDLRTGHGFPSTDQDMFTAFCAQGGGFNTNRMEGVKTIDIAPTVADYLGIFAPRDARGQSVLQQLMN